MLFWQRRHHNPVLGALMPEDFRVAKIRHVQVNHRIACVLREGTSAIIAVGDVLRLQRLAICTFLGMAGVNGDQTGNVHLLKNRRVRVLAESAAVFPIHHHAARKDHYAVFLGDRRRQLLPVDEIRAHGVTPSHMSPLVAERVVLIEEVIFASEVHRAVRVVGPVDGRREVILRAIGFVEKSRG